MGNIGLNELLRRRRIELGLTQQETADRAEIRLQHYQKFEYGRRDLLRASFDVACGVLEALEFDIEQVFREYVADQTGA